MKVLGLDPGSRRTGWGVVVKERHGQRGIAAGVIKVREKDPLETRILHIHRGVSALIEEHCPDAVAIEDIFFAKYPKAALALGHARGVALLAAAQADLPLSAYPPAVVKRAIAGRGAADKRQVAMLVGALLGWRELPAEDATDALAIAITHLNAVRTGGAARLSR